MIKLKTKMKEILFDIYGIQSGRVDERKANEFRSFHFRIVQQNEIKKNSII